MISHATIVAKSHINHTKERVNSLVRNPRDRRTRHPPNCVAPHASARYQVTNYATSSTYPRPACSSTKPSLPFLSIHVSPTRPAPFTKSHTTSAVHAMMQPPPVITPPARQIVDRRGTGTVATPSEPAGLPQAVKAMSTSKRQQSAAASNSAIAGSVEALEAPTVPCYYSTLSLNRAKLFSMDGTHGRQGSMDPQLSRSRGNVLRRQRQAAWPGFHF